jgi:hypothetical protein
VTTTPLQAKLDSPNLSVPTGLWIGGRETGASRRCHRVCATS